MRIYKFVIFLNDLGKKILNSVPNLYTTKFTGNRSIHKQLICSSIQAILHKHRNHLRVTRLKRSTEPLKNFVFSFVLEGNIRKLLGNHIPQTSSQKYRFSRQKILKNQVISQVFTQYSFVTVKTSMF